MTPYNLELLQGNMKIKVAKMQTRQKIHPQIGKQKPKARCCTRHVYAEPDMVCSQFQKRVYGANNSQDLAIGLCFPSLSSELQFFFVLWAIDTARYLALFCDSAYTHTYLENFTLLFSTLSPSNLTPTSVVKLMHN